MSSVIIPALNKRKLILHDGLAFVTLTATSIVLFVLTLLLFRSFEDHRADLAVRWAERGKTALAGHRPEQAVAALRTALSYAPDERGDQLLLAQALANAGHTEEASNYFLNLWEARPGDGFINLQLARLARGKGQNKDAEDYYRASIFGAWDGDAVLRRRQVRLELVDFLLGRHQLSQARNELFVIAGNAPEDAALNLLLAEKFQAAQDPADALSFDEKTLADEPHSEQALAQGGRLAYQLGDYAKAQRLLHRALEEKPAAEAAPSLTALLNDAAGMQELTLTRDQPANERADHILPASRLAQARLKACTAAQPAGAPPAALADLNARWTAATAGARGRRSSLLASAAAQDSWTQLIFETEQTTERLCGRPTGQDALLLKMAEAGKGQTNGR